MTRFQTERSAEENERAFLEAMAQGRDEAPRTTIQDLERYASNWADLVPPDPNLRAALARMLGAKYLMPEHSVAAIQTVLGLDETVVAQTFEGLHGQPLPTIYAPSIPWRERLRWARSHFAYRLETLPPFWTAFSLTLTETVGAGLLALPIAVAGVGPIAGVGVIVILGLVNMLTIAAVSEAVARNGNMRYGHAFYGRLVQDYLGRPGLWILTPSLALLSVLCLLVYYIGLSTTLASATSVPAELWAALIFLIGMVLLRRESLNATVASALVIGATSIALIVLLALLALPSLSASNLRHSEIPGVNGQPFDTSLLGLIFGVIMMSFFGHTSAGNCAAIVLRRDPSGVSFIRGSTAAIGVAMLLYCLWVVAINGALPADALVGETGTALEPLADEIGPSIHFVGSVFAVLAMGMASVHFSLSLINLVREWIPVAIDGGGVHRRLGRVDLPSGRIAAGMLPVVLVIVIAEALLLSDNESFVGPMAFMGAVTASLIGGVFPMMMVVASRRKGDCAVSSVWRLVGHPVVAVAVSAVFFAGLLLHGLVLWDIIYQQAAAIFAFVATLAVIVIALRRGAFRRRTIVEIREDPRVDAPAVVSVVSAGEPVEVSIRWPEMIGRRTSGFRSVMIDLPALDAEELRIWTHQLDADGTSRDLPVSVDIDGTGTCRHVDLRSTGNHVVPTDGGAAHLSVARAESATPAHAARAGATGIPVPSHV